jgi:hypothetical protein
VPPRLNEVRTVFGRNGFEVVRRGKHELWVRKSNEGVVQNRVPVSYGNAEIRTQRLFRDILRQAGKTEARFYELLK